jgi:hypothetical protein
MLAGRIWSRFSGYAFCAAVMFVNLILRAFDRDAAWQGAPADRATARRLGGTISRLDLSEPGVPHIL